jgi:UDP-3-O-[3-hydroxymyristoyl] glucosamine N-acyltransferase
MKYLLSGHFESHELKRDGSFSELGHADSATPDTLAYCDSAYYLEAANANPSVSCILTTPDLAAKVAVSKGVAIAANPRVAFYRLHERLWPDPKTGDTQIHPSAIVSHGTKIGRGVIISERAVVKDGVEIGDGSFVDVGAVLGAEGLLYVREDGENRRVRHLGGVRIGKQVTILANAVLARGIHPGLPTVVEDRAIVGIATTIGHEAHIGSNCIVSGNCVIARRAEIGEKAWIGASSMIREYVRIGARASVMAGSVVLEDVPEDAKVSGNFAIPHRRRMLQYLKDKR